MTRHGETVGYYIPTKHHTEQHELDALIQAAKTLEKLLSSHELNEDQLLAEFRGCEKKPQGRYPMMKSVWKKDYKLHEFSSFSIRCKHINSRSPRKQRKLEMILLNIMIKKVQIYNFVNLIR